jgi:Ras-related protein Rab-1A
LIEAGVGKTCLLLRFVDDRFSTSFITTIGIDFKVKHVTVAERIVKLQIWDTAGQERFRHITTSYFRGAEAVVLVYDVTDRDTFDHIADWVHQVVEEVRLTSPFTNAVF